MDDLHHLGREPAYPAGVHGAGDRAAGRSPLRTALGLAPLHALVVCIIGNMLPIPFIIVYIRRIFHWMRRRSPRLNALVDKLEKKAHLKGQKVTKYKYIACGSLWPSPCPARGRGRGADRGPAGYAPAQVHSLHLPRGGHRGADYDLCHGGRGGDFRLPERLFLSSGIEWPGGERK